MTAAPPTEHQAAVVDALLPGADVAAASVVRSGSHDVVLLLGVAAVRIARSEPAAAALPRRTAVLARLAEAGLPFGVPVPLGPVTTVAGATAVAVSWVPGEYAAGTGDPRALRAVLDALAAVDVGPLGDVLDRPHAYAGRERWAELMLGEAVPRLPPRLHDSARRRMDAALALEPVPPGLVHGDLTGENMHWSADGRLVGVIDWDLAQPFDPAIDAACLAHWHGWSALRATVDGRTYDRARTWYGTFAMEQIVKLLLDGAGDAAMARCVDRVVRWMDTDGCG